MIPMHHYSTAHVGVTQLGVLAAIHAVLVIFDLTDLGQQLFRLLLLFTGHGGLGDFRNGLVACSMQMIEYREHLVGSDLVVFSAKRGSVV